VTVTAGTTDARGTLDVGDDRYVIHRLDAVDVTERLPVALRILLANALAGGRDAASTAVDALRSWPQVPPDAALAFRPTRVLMHDTTGVPALVDLAALRDALHRAGRPPSVAEPDVPVDLIIDHSVTVDVFGRADAAARNVAIEHRRNAERYRFLKWASQAFDRVRVVPPGAGILHQVNIEHLATVVTARGGEAFPDAFVGTDSHTTMANGLGVLAWGVGGVEALAAMLGQALHLPVPQVVGVELGGDLPSGATVTDLVLRLTELLRQHGVVGRFVEFHGPAVARLSVADRATIANMSPEFGATCAMFPVDDRTLEYLQLTGRPDRQVALVEAYAREQGLWAEPGRPGRAVYSDDLMFDLASVVPCVAGPHRPERRVPLSSAGTAWRRDVRDETDAPLVEGRPRTPVEIQLDDGGEATIDHGHVAIAAITSCTNTSNPALMLTAGLLARNAVDRGVRTAPGVKTSLAPGSQVVADYYRRAELLEPLAQLGFDVVGFGCTTCIGNSGPLPEPVGEAVASVDLVTTAVLSGNRNFQGRINPQVRMAYLASPPLVVAYALAGTMDIDLTSDPLTEDAEGRPVHLADLWPRPEEVEELLERSVSSGQFTDRYADIFDGDAAWDAVEAPTGERFAWDPTSTYLREPPYLDGVTAEPEVRPIEDARVLAVLGDQVTTDHLSPAGAIPPDGPAGRWLTERGVPLVDLNTFPTRRGNHEVMVRGALANPSLRNGLVPGGPAGHTRDFTRDGQVTTVHAAAITFRRAGIPLVILAGESYGNGSSRDWAAKGPALLGVRAVIARSFERIHRANLVGLGVLPLQFVDDECVGSLGLRGDEEISVLDLDARPGGQARIRAVPPRDAGRGPVDFDVLVRLDTDREVAYHHHGGILPYVLRGLLSDRGGDRGG
jgi:aconitate hydratase